MRRLLAVMVVLAICVVGFGFYRGWFALSSPSPAEGSGKINVNLTTNTDLIKADAQTAQDKAAELTGQSTGKPVEEERKRLRREPRNQRLIRPQTTCHLLSNSTVTPCFEDG